MKIKIVKQPIIQVDGKLFKTSAGAAKYITKQMFWFYQDTKKIGCEYETGGIAKRQRAFVKRGTQKAENELYRYTSAMFDRTLRRVKKVVANKLTLG